VLKSCKEAVARTCREKRDSLGFAEIGGAGKRSGRAVH
jgi:hypothetical protein